MTNLSETARSADGHVTVVGLDFVLGNGQATDERGQLEVGQVGADLRGHLYTLHGNLPGGGQHQHLQPGQLSL